MRTYQTTVKTTYFIQIKVGNINIVNDCSYTKKIVHLFSIRACLFEVIQR